MPEEDPYAHLQNDLSDQHRFIFDRIVGSHKRVLDHTDLHIRQQSANARERRVESYLSFKGQSGHDYINEITQIANRLSGYYWNHAKHGYWLDFHFHLAISKSSTPPYACHVGVKVNDLGYITEKLLPSEVGSPDAKGITVAIEIAEELMAAYDQVSRKVRTRIPHA